MINNVISFIWYEYCKLILQEVKQKVNDSIKEILCKIFESIFKPNYRSLVVGCIVSITLRSCDTIITIFLRNISHVIHVKSQIFHIVKFFLNEIWIHHLKVAVAWWKSRKLFEFPMYQGCNAVYFPFRCELRSISVWQNIKFDTNPSNCSHIGTYLCSDSPSKIGFSPRYTRFPYVNYRLCLRKNWQEHNYHNRFQSLKLNLH